MIGLLNPGSLMLGLLAWTIPLVNLFLYRKNHVTLSIMSMGACAISLCFQIFYHSHLVAVGDWSAIMDTTGTMAFISGVLLIGTIVLNAITLIVYRQPKMKKSEVLS